MICIISAAVMPLCNSVAATSPIIYGKIKQSETNSAYFFIGICTKTSAELPIGAIKFTLEYDSSCTKFVSAQLNDNRNDTKIEINCNEGYLQIIYGSVDGKSITLKDDLELITIKFKNLEKELPISLNLQCNQCIDAGSDDIELLYIDNISEETERIIEESSDIYEIAKVAEKVTDSSSEDSSAASEAVLSNGGNDVGCSESNVDSEYYADTIIIEPKSNTLSSMIIGGLIVLNVTVLVILGYKIGRNSVIHNKADKDQDDEDT